MKANHKLWLIGCAVVFILAFGLYYVLRDEPIVEPTKQQESSVSRMAFSGTKLTEEQDGKQVWELTARVMEVDPKTKLVYLTELAGVLFRADGTKIEISAKNAVVNQQTNDLEMSGSIRMVASDGATFQAEKGNYAAKTRKITASGGVQATREDYVLTASEMETDDRFEIIVIRGKARIVKGGTTQ